MRHRQTITRQAATRLLISLGLFVIALSVTSALVYSTVLNKAAHERAENLQVFYQSRLQQLEREWEVQSHDFKNRIEFTRYLEQPATAAINLQAFFTIQSGERRFSQLLVQDQTGAIRFKLNKEGRYSNTLKPDESSGWYWNADDAKLYRVFKENIWLGKAGTGWMTAYYPIDNARLYNLLTPGVMLAARYQNKTIASSMGAAGLDAVAAAPDAFERREIPWTADANSPLTLLIDAQIKGIFSTIELTLGVGLIPLLDALILWFALGTWMMKQTRRIRAMGAAVIEFPQYQEVSPRLHQQLQIAQSGKRDEIYDVSYALEALAEYTVAQRKQHLREEAEIRLWSSVFKSSAEPIIITDRDLCIVAVNPAFLQKTGYAAEDILGKNPRILSPRPESAEFYTKMWRAIAEQGYWQGEIWYKDKDGTEQPYLMSISCVKDLHDNIVNYVGYYTSISERIRAETELKLHRDNLEELVIGRTMALESANRQLTASEAALHQAQAVARIGSWRLDLSKNTLLWSDQTCRIFGLPIGSPITYAQFLSYVHDDDRALLESSWQDALRGKPYNIEHRIVVAGEVKWVREQAELVFSADGRAQSAIGTVQDITELKQYEQKIEQMAYFDALTQLPNRRMLSDRLSHTIANGKRNGLVSALMFIDLDNFKPLNDQYGHVVGDLLLVEVARRLSGCVRETDTVARFGGDEFVVLLCELDRNVALAQEQAAATAEKIRITLARPYLLLAGDTGQKTVEHLSTPSIGVAMFAGAEVSMDEIINHADTAMYRAKQDGRNLIRFYTA
jgi:diguanylate cyclase (GGDEF)-like protein/PAS domain S-box-containing protein